MWTATGRLYGQNVTLTWDGGPLEWPPGTLAMVIDDVTRGVEVAYTPTGPFDTLNLNNERAVIYWLAEQGMTISGDIPTWHEPEAAEDVVY